MGERTDREKWEVYIVLADSETFGTSPQHLYLDAHGGRCCEPTVTDSQQDAAGTSCC